MFAIGLERTRGRGRKKKKKDEGQTSVCNLCGQATISVTRGEEIRERKKKKKKKRTLAGASIALKMLACSAGDCTPSKERKRPVETAKRRGREKKKKNCYMSARRCVPCFHSPKLDYARKCDDKTGDVNGGRGRGKKGREKKKRGKEKSLHSYPNLPSYSRVIQTTLAVLTMWARKGSENRLKKEEKGKRKEKEKRNVH